jgi:hypothetical protein
MEHLNSKNIALTAVFAALYYVMSYLPGIPAIGVPGVKIQLEACMASVFGLILGPYLGALATLVGVTVAWALPPGSASPQSLIFLPSPVINAFIVGLIYDRRWKVASAILAPLVLAFWFLPPAQPIEQNFIVGVAAMWDKVLALALIVPTVMLMRKHAVSLVKNEPMESKIKKLGINRIIIILAVLSSMLMLYNAYMISSSGDILKYEVTFRNEKYKFNFGYKSIIRQMAQLGYLWVWNLVGVGILVGAFMSQLKPKYNIIWGGLIIALSGFSAIMGGGFIAGLILGVIAGLLSIAKVKISMFKMPSTDFLIYFLLAFIGNEADNAWGNNIFAVPFVYEGLFSMNLEAVRLAFLISPYAYFIIRLIQAVIAALIALPLVNNLRMAGFGRLRE